MKKISIVSFPEDIMYLFSLNNIYLDILIAQFSLFCDNSGTQGNYCKSIYDLLP